jgi:hypothetical protein
MSMIGELTFFLGFQVKQMKEVHLLREIHKRSSQEIQDG